MDKVYLSAEGLQKMQDELMYLKGPKRQEIILAVKTAREHGDLSENAEYDAAKEEQAKLEQRISELENSIANAEIIDRSKIPANKISVGQKVVLEDLKNNETFTYALVSPPEADFEAGKISVASPIGKGLVGKEIGQEVKINIPAGERHYKILSTEII